jgi:hypothetical protein
MGLLQSYELDLRRRPIGPVALYQSFHDSYIVPVRPLVERVHHQLDRVVHVGLLGVRPRLPLALSRKRPVLAPMRCRAGDVEYNLDSDCSVIRKTRFASFFPLPANLTLCQLGLLGRERAASGLHKPRAILALRLSPNPEREAPAVYFPRPPLCPERSHSSWRIVSCRERASTILLMLSRSLR